MDRVLQRSDTFEAGPTFSLLYPQEFSSFLLSPHGQQSCICVKTQQSGQVVIKNLEIKIIRGNLRISGKSWSSVDSERPTHIKIIAMHGWLDNSDSFARLAPMIVQYYYDNTHDVQVTIVAYDQVGCGWSQHRGGDYVNSAIEYSMDMIEVINALGWRTCGVLAHSLGSSVALTTISTFGERFEFYVSIDSFGTFTMQHPDVEAPFQLRHAITDRLKYNHSLLVNPQAIKGRSLLFRPQQFEKVKNYNREDVIDDAANQLVKRYRIYGLDKQSALLFLPRMLHIDEQNVMNSSWNADPRLYHHITPLPSEADMEALIKNIKCPTLLIMAEKGYPFDRNKFRTRLNILKHAEVIWIPEMHHHFHMSHPEQVLSHLVKFLDTKNTVQSRFQLVFKVKIVKVIRNIVQLL
ncbi:serine hydrolase-like protein [Acrasis kona]|uniref:Serine hydrolase-like protein n=1 Tax=Acrasis kona TaxID=1008807 RepID=A0AAW2Z7B5_9EUKA